MSTYEQELDRQRGERTEDDQSDPNGQCDNAENDEQREEERQSDQSDDDSIDSMWNSKYGLNRYRFVDITRYAYGVFNFLSNILSSIILNNFISLFQTIQLVKVMMRMNGTRRDRTSSTR